jgi:hypothetical protein
MNRGKEILIQEDDKFLVKIGTVDNKNPKSIFLTLSSWTHPKTEQDLNYGRIISHLRKKIKQKVFETDSNMFDRYRTIVDLDLRASGISVLKKSYMSCEITMFQNENISIKSPEIIDYFKNVSNTLIADIFDQDIVFDYNISK